MQLDPTELARLGRALKSGLVLSRRHFALLGAAAAALPLLPRPALGITLKSPKLSDYPFKLGVASGDPLPTGVVLWTRLAPEPTTGGGMPNENVEVRWQVARDEGMTQIVKQGAVVATPEAAHSVHIEVDGLEPDRWYWYQFAAAGETSRKGRTRTAPAFDATPSRLNLAFASCQHYEQGFFTAYEHMVRDELDLILHLGDYIYEYGGKEKLARKHVGPELTTLDDYRNRYAQYHADEQLQTAHAYCPWLVTWDDHEFDNNYANHVSEEPNVATEGFLKRRAAAYRAYYEHMPLRAAQMPHGPDLELYRQVHFGRLAQFSILDTRQYRTDQPCGDGNKPPCADALDPQASLMGPAQRAWLFDRLQSSPATWNVLAQQVMMARVDRVPGEVIAHSMDQWPGYEAERRSVLQFLADKRIKNPVVLTGDIHSNWANELQVHRDDLQGPVVASEFVGTSITSGGDGSPTGKDTPGVLAENPFVKFYNRQRGYVRVSITPQRWQSDYRVLDYVTKRGSPIGTAKSFVVESGSPKLHEA
ncbi:MAG: alkaline phosphatase D family protein [Planctomycetes bacterium]|nr:alkaline phosphatase D family protein [Planctomycetota bacterium]